MSPHSAPGVKPGLPSSVESEPVAAAAESQPPPRLLDRVRQAIRARHYSLRTEDAYVDWIRRYILFHGKRHPARDGRARDQGLPDPPRRRPRASRRHPEPGPVRAAVPLPRRARQCSCPGSTRSSRAKRPQPPARRSDARGGARRCWPRLNGTPGLVATLLYGTGMRLLEALRLRVKDVEFGAARSLVRDGKGGKDRVTVLPDLILPLQAHLAVARSACTQSDLRGRLRRGLAARRPAASTRGAERELGLAMGLPRPDALGDPRTGVERRHHLHETAVQRAVAGAARRPASSSRARRTCCATRSPPTCWRRATTSAPSRSCSATAT